MSEEELVEAVARAMAEYDYGDGNDEPWEPFAGLARAIIPIVKEADARSWQPIETAPKDERILFLARGKTVFLGEWNETWDSFEPEYAEVPMFSDEDAANVTHWMPLPPPPIRGEA